MRKFLTFLFALAIALPATAGWLPDALCDGDNGAATPGPFWVQLYLDEFQNGAPFSIPSPVGLNWWFGKIWFDDDNAYVEVDARSRRWCEEPPFGLPPGYGTEVCYSSRPVPIDAQSYVIPWDDEANAYLLRNDDGSFLSLVVDLESATAVFAKGALLVLPGPEIVIDPQANLFVFQVEPQAVEVITNVRRGGRR